MPPDGVRWAFFDTSVLAKRYVREPGSAQAQALLRAHGIIVSAVAPVELVSAFHRRKSARDLSQRSFEAIVGRIRHDRAYWTLVDVTVTVLDRAEEIISQTGLRTLDAIHVASALHVRAAAAPSGTDLSFVTADGPQRDAAARLGLEVQWVE